MGCKINMYKDGDTLVLIFSSYEKKELVRLVGSLVMLGTGDGKGTRLTTFEKDGKLALSFHAADPEFEKVVMEKLQPARQKDVTEARPVRHEAPSGMPIDYRFKKGRYAGKTPAECVASDSHKALQYLQVCVVNAKQIPDAMLAEITRTVRRAAREAIGPDGRLLQKLKEDDRMVNNVLEEYLLAVPAAELAGLTGMDPKSGYGDIAARIKHMSIEEKRKLTDGITAYLAGVRANNK